jgi:hypothetical protein
MGQRYAAVDGIVSGDTVLAASTGRIAANTAVQLAP